MSNLKNFNNIYADLAESSYNGRPNSFSMDELNDYRKQELANSKSVFFDFSKDATINNQTTQGGTNLPNDGIVYLQPDPTLKSNYMTGKDAFGEPTAVWLSDKGLLTDTKAGFNAYYLTDTPTLNADTKNTYLAVRGSDGMGLANANDWIGNNAIFTLNDAHIPQAKLTTAAMKAKIKEMEELAPNAKMNVTGHSLGTMASVQGLAGLTAEELSRIGEVVLFNGADCTDSLRKMGLSESEIQAIGEKVTYYVNPFDMVSRLNRTGPVEEQLGTVHCIIPVHFSDTFAYPDESSHDFGEYQLDAYGKPLLASEDFHPEFLRAGERLSDLIESSIKDVKAFAGKTISGALIVKVLSLGSPAGIVTLLAAQGIKITIDEASKLLADFENEYAKIIEDTRKATQEWNAKAIPNYQSRIRSATGAEKIALRNELLQTVAQDAILTAEDHVMKVEKDLAASKEMVQQAASQGRQGAYMVMNYLSHSEVESLVADFTPGTFWDESLEDTTIKAAKDYQKELEQVAASLMQISRHIEETDKAGAAGFEAILTDIAMNWSVN